MASILILALILALPLGSVAFRLMHAPDGGVGKALRNILSGAIVFGLIAPLIGYFSYAAFLCFHMASSTGAAIKVFFTSQVFFFSVVSYFFSGVAAVLTGVIAGAAKPWIRTWLHLVSIGMFGVDFQGNALWSRELSPLSSLEGDFDSRFEPIMFELTDTDLLIHGKYGPNFVKKPWTIKIDLNQLNELAMARGV